MAQNSQKPDTHTFWARATQRATTYRRFRDTRCRRTRIYLAPGPRGRRGTAWCAHQRARSNGVAACSDDIRPGRCGEPARRTDGNNCDRSQPRGNDQKHTMFGLPSASASDKLLVPATSAKQHEPPGQPSLCCTCVRAWVQHIAAWRKHADSKHGRGRTHGARTCTRRTHTPPRHPSLLTHAMMHNDPSYLPLGSLLFLLPPRDCALRKRGKAFARCVAAIRAYLACVIRELTMVRPTIGKRSASLPTVGARSSRASSCRPPCAACCKF